MKSLFDTLPCLPDAKTDETSAKNANTIRLIFMVLPQFE
jgi:hypothetical protein